MQQQAATARKRQENIQGCPASAEQMDRVKCSSAHVHNTHLHGEERKKKVWRTSSSGFTEVLGAKHGRQAIIPNVPNSCPSRLFAERCEWRAR